MKRKDFLKGLGMASVLPVVPTSTVQATESSSEMATSGLKYGISKSGLDKFRKMVGDPNACVLIPSETRGPYPLDLSSNQNMFRKAINETKTGVPLTVTLTFVNVNADCKPITNARIDIWHCDKDGLYSGYSNSQNQGQTGLTYCRGIQITDSNGQVTFTTIYPGWYAGRITHIHFEIYINSVLKATSQLGFPQDTTTAVYNSDLYKAKGQNTSVTSFSADNVFSDGVSNQLATITGDVTNGYTATLQVGIAAGTTGIFNLEPDTGGVFKLKPNFPNPFTDKTHIPFTLNSNARVQLELYNIMGQKVATIVDKNMEIGDHLVPVNAKSLNLAKGDYVYQITTTNEYGRFTQCKLMSLL